MKRRTFLRGVLAGAALWAATGPVKLSRASLAMSHTSGMNVLFINIDDISASRLACYGHPIAQTPHIDRFVSTAVRFARCYCQAPMAYPSRSSFLTGLRPETTGIHSNADLLDQCLPAGTRSLPELLDQYGITTVNIGNLLAVPGPPELQDDPQLNETDSKKAGLAAHVLEQLAQQKRQFFLSLDFTGPWVPSRCPDEYLDRYPPDTIPLPVACPQKDANVPRIARHGDRDSAVLKGNCQGAMKDGNTRQIIRAYYGRLSFLDAQIGVVLDALKRTGLSNNTIVIIFGANGIQLGEHGLWGDSTLLEQCTHVPLLVRVPGVTTKGIVCDEIVELVDLFPTLCQLLVIPPPDGLEGVSLAPLLADARQPWKLAAFTVCSVGGHRGCSVRTKRWRYTDWQSRATSLREFELYDLDSDPWEQQNIAQDDGCRNQRTILANLLQRGWPVAYQQNHPNPAAPANRASHRAGHILW